MLSPKDRLWPFHRTLALLLAPVVWILFAILFALLHRYTGWPDKELRAPLIYAAIALGLVPLTLVLLDFAAGRRAVLDFKGIRIDFSQAGLGPAGVRARSAWLPDNIGIPGTILSNTSAMQIIAALEQAAANEVVLVDIKDGHAWWVTRLLALSAGAVRAGSPKALVFLGMRQNVDGAYLGWAEPAAVLDALLADKSEYRAVYERAVKITRQLALFGDPEVASAGIEPNPHVARYSSRPDYVALGDAALEQILMDQLATILPVGLPAGRSLEDPPDRLTLRRLYELLEPCLYLDAVDLTASTEDQVSSFLGGQAPYVGLVRGGKYESMLKREVGERLVLRGLLAQSRPGP